MMRRSCYWIAVAAVSIYWVGHQSYGQDETQAEKSKPDNAAVTAVDSSTAKKETTSSKSPAKAKGRLPRNYGQLGLSDRQRVAVYAIQAKHRPAIEKLTKQLEELKAKQAVEIKAVLTPAQASRLAALRAAPKKKRAKSKAARK